MANKIFFLDAYALIFRAYYAFIKSPRINSKKVNTSAVFGFVNTLEDVLKREKPTHIAVAFDPSGPNFRHEVFPTYKANRPPTPEDIKVAVPYIKQILEAYKIPIIQISGFEADDVIGTLAKRFADDENTVYMMTPDKDYGQLVDKNIFIYKPSHSGGLPEILGVEEVNQKFSIDSPIKVIDILALWGDSVDNIPGVPGIGTKTASKLLQKFGSIEGICNNLDKLQGKQRLALEENVEQLKLSYLLATIKLDVPVEISLEDMKLEEPDFKKLDEIFTDLEFFSLKQRIVGSKGTVTNTTKPKAEQLAPNPNPNPQPEGQLQLDLFSAAPIYTSHENLVKYERTFKKIESAADLENLVKILENAKEYAFFAASDTNDTIKAKIAGMAFSTNQKEAYYINCYEKSDELKSILDLLKPIFTDKAKTIIGHNLKIDLQILENYGINVENPLFDTMLAHYIINPEKKHDIGLLANSELSIQALHCGYVSGESERKTMNINTDSGLALNYSCERAALSLQLKETFSKQISELGKDKLLYEIELPLIKVLMAMERTGVKIDSEAMSDYSKKLQEELREISDKIYDYAGTTFNISSPKQLGTVLFEKMQIAKPKLTKTKSYSTGEEELMKLINKHPIINQILEYRSINKLISTYVDVLPTLVNAETGMLHTSFNQIVTATGRLSSSNPNLQNIPIRDDRGKVIRSAFIASDDEHIFLSADYSQIELRVMAHLSQDEAMLDAFNKYSLDIHTATAAKIFKVSESEVTREMRSKAKTANFGIIYGISAFGLGQRLQISVSEGKSLINSYFETFKGVKQFIDDSIMLAREKEYAETMFGRRRYLPDINSRNSVVRSFAERNAVNAPIQGTAADIVKIAMINIDKRLRENGLKAKMILQVHDELNFNVPKCEMETVKQIVVEEMENCVKLSVPLIVDAKFGKNWLEAH